MPIAPGKRFGSFEITESIGVGGMDQVWHATDSRLKREVALKALPPEFVGDAEFTWSRRRARLLRSDNSVVCAGFVCRLAAREALISPPLPGNSEDIVPNLIADRSIESIDVGEPQILDALHFENSRPGHPFAHSPRR